jgi:thymidylate synthase
MTKWDKEYIKLCKKILKNGVVSQNRTGIDTIKIPEYTFKLDVGKEYPVLTTKKLYFKKAILEMMWIYQAKSNDVRWLQDRDIHIWDEWEINENGMWYATQNVMENGKYVKKDIAKNFGKEYAHTIGTAYGYIVKKFNLIDNIIKTIKENPQDRRMVMSLWQNDYLDTAVLPSCVWSSEWDVTNGKLNAWVHQRSCDVPLGLPFNVTQYATLLCMIAHVTNLKPGTLSWSIKDAQIYVNQVDGIKEQIKRFDEGKVMNAPKLWLNPEIKDFFDFDNSKELKDIKIIGYESMEPIKFPIAQ